MANKGSEDHNALAEQELREMKAEINQLRYQNRMLKLKNGVQKENLDILFRFFETATEWMLQPRKLSNGQTRKLVDLFIRDNPQYNYLRYEDCY